MALRETNLPEVDLGCIPMLSRVRSQPGEREGSRKRSGRATALANSSIVSRQEARGEAMRKDSWWGRGIVCFLVAAATVLAGTGSESAAEAIPRPNFLILVSDDQRAETMGFMPRTEQRIFEEGIAFANAFATTPLCCPSRASLLTGMYAHRHGVRTNNISLTLPTVFDRLHDAGYFTGLVGKYLNSWDGTPRPEFDFWVSFPGAGAAYVNPSLNVGGQFSPVPSGGVGAGKAVRAAVHSERPPPSRHPGGGGSVPLLESPRISPSKLQRGGRLG